jgi:glycosyltransferase involved in cell wall biosynthesis/acetyltransferase-like isoleucine patch superfamily enzyme
MTPDKSRVPLVSVIIPTYNYGPFVADAVEGALAQTYPNIEVIVVDDGSTDNTQDVLRRFEGKIINIRKENAGLSAARNTGIERARGDYIAILDSDDVWLPEKLREQMPLFDSEEVGVVSCGAYEVSNNLEIKGELDYSPYYDNQNHFYLELVKRNIVSGGSRAVIRKECLSRVGGFDVELSPSADWEMWLRIAPHYKIRYLKKPLLKVRVGAGSMSSIRHADTMLDNELRVIQKHVRTNPLFKRSRKLRRAALGYRYFCAAWAHWRGHDNREARRHIWKSFFCDPLSFLDRRQGGLFARIMIGSLLRVSVPVNRLTRPFFRALYLAHVFAREALIVALKFFYYEPLFRGQCEKVGRALWMERLPYIVGKGRIVIGDFVRLSGKPSIAFSSKICTDPRLVVGSHTFIGHGARFAVAREIRIGEHCYIAGGTVVSDNDGHPLDHLERRAGQPPGKEDARPVVIGDDVWIGREAVILKGVTIGDRAVIGTRAVVTRDVPEDTIVAGNPAREIRKVTR